MVQDSDIQVWLDTQAAAGQMQVVPYVASRVDRHVSYRINVIRRGDGGSKMQISQSGRAEVPAATATALSRVALGNSAVAQCSVDVVLRDGARELGIYHFDCGQ